MENDIINPADPGGNTSFLPPGCPGDRTVAGEEGLKKETRDFFSLTQLVDRCIIQPFDVTIPVPAGEEEKAIRIVQELGGEVPDEA
ncbi:MAG: hypothetical protein WC620_03150 [Methanoregula sp.]|jgi:hypothetical protein